MLHELRFFILLTLVGASVGARAQLDSSSAVLLRTKSRTANPENLDLSRYKIRAPESRKDNSDEQDVTEKEGYTIPSPVPSQNQKAVTTKTVTQVSAPAPTPSPAPVTPQAPQASEATPSPAEPPANATVTDQVKELILGGNRNDIEDYQRQIHPEDPRANLVSVSLAPGYYYNDSQSAYSFRRYTSNGPAMGLGMNLWFTPFFGLQSKFFTTVSGSQRSGGLNQVPIDIQTFEAGVRFRRHFGFSRKAAHLSWGIDYHDGMNNISKTAVTAVGRKSSGLSVAVEGVIPTSVSYAHTILLEVRPRLRHVELNTGIDARSGQSNETNGLGLGLGGQWTLDRKNQFFWQGRFYVERSLYNGAASLVDPHNGQTPNGVSVTNNLLILNFGFKWGS